MALSRLPSLFQSEQQRGPEQSHIAELEQLVGRQTLELEIVNKSLQAAPWDRGHLKMLPARSAGSRGLYSLNHLSQLGAPRASAAILTGENIPWEERLQ